jgi:hypothetical protein
MELERGGHEAQTWDDVLVALESIAEGLEVAALLDVDALIAATKRRWTGGDPAVLGPMPVELRARAEHLLERVRLLELQLLDAAQRVAGELSAITAARTRVARLSSPSSDPGARYIDKTA